VTESLDELLARLDELKKDVRKQGRASIAAQSAAESCLESVQELGQRLDNTTSQPAQVSQPDPVEDIVRALAPLVDALERTTDQAQSFAESAVKPSGLARWLGAADNTAVLTSMAKGTRLLRAQLEDALSTWGVSVDRRTGVPVDPSRHRVVDTRPARDGESPDHIVEVVRPVLLCGDQVMREGDVVAAR